MKTIAEECLRVHPTSRGGYYYKALAQFALLELHEAKQTIEKAMALDKWCDWNENNTLFNLRELLESVENWIHELKTLNEVFLTPPESNFEFLVVYLMVFVTVRSRKTLCMDVWIDHDFHLSQRSTRTCQSIQNRYVLCLNHSFLEI